MIAFLPAADSLRFGFVACDVPCYDCPDAPMIWRHRHRWASFIHLRVAAENFWRLGVGTPGVAELSAGLLFKRLRSSKIQASIRILAPRRTLWLVPTDPAYPFI